MDHQDMESAIMKEHDALKLFLSHVLPPEGPSYGPKTFPLLQLPPILLKQIIGKLESRSYFRLQQTCRQLGEFIQSTPIQMSVLKGCTLEWKRDQDENLILEFLKNYFIPSLNSTPRTLKGEKMATVMHLESLYGLRFKSVVIESNSAEDIDQICKVLKTYRITAASIYFIESKVELTKKDCIQLFQVLKPNEWVNLECFKSNQWKSVLVLSPTSTAPVVTVPPRDVLRAVRKLVPNLPAAIVYCNWDGLVEKEVSDSITSILKLFLYQSVPKRSQLFAVSATWNRPKDPLVTLVTRYFSSSNPSVNGPSTCVEFATAHCKLILFQGEIVFMYTPE